MANKSFPEQLRKEIKYIKKLFECTEAEAFFILRLENEKWDPTDSSMYVTSGMIEKKEFNDPRSWAYYIAAETMDMLDAFRVEALDPYRGGEPPPGAERRGKTDPLFAIDLPPSNRSEVC